MSLLFKNNESSFGLSEFSDYSDYSDYSEYSEYSDYSEYSEYSELSKPFRSSLTAHHSSLISHPFTFFLHFSMRACMSEAISLWKSISSPVDGWVKPSVLACRACLGQSSIQLRMNAL